MLAKNVEDFTDRKNNQRMDTAAVENHNIIGDKKQKKYIRLFWTHNEIN